jgi:hypothetical protein
MKMKHLSMISVGAQKTRLTNLGRFALGTMCVFGFVESNRAQGTLSATATLTETGTAGGEYEYSLTLDNTGSVPINAFWYGWVQGSFDLPSTPTSITAPSGWSSSTSFADSVVFENNSGSAVAAGGTGTFTFESTFGPSAMTSGTTDGAPTGDSVVYASASGPGTFGENDPGVASGPFQPTATAVPEPSTFGLVATGLTGMSFWLARRRSGA